MVYKVDDSLTNFMFWSGAATNAELLTYDELKQLDDILPEYFGEEIPTQTEINDMFWFGLIGRCTCRIDEVHHGTQFCSLPCECLHAILLQGVHYKRLHIIATTAEVFADALKSILADVAQQDFLT